MLDSLRLPVIFNYAFLSSSPSLSTRMGIELEDFSVLVHVRIHIGTTYASGNQGKIIVNDAWGYSVTAYPAQVGVKYFIVVIY